MNNLSKTYPFKVDKSITASGTITVLTAATTISHQDSIPFEEKILLAIYVDNDVTYHLVYTIIDANGEVTDSFQEDSGILPTLFLNQNGKVHVSITHYFPGDKELEISIPVFSRSTVELPKGNREFTGKFIGISNHSSIFYDVDPWSKTKPDKMLAVEFQEGLIKKKHNIKIALPRNNKIYISNNEIHLLAFADGKRLHRQIDEKGNEIKRRVITLEKNYIREVLCLSFEKDSYLLHEDNGEIGIVTIDADAVCSYNKIASVESPFYSSWQPVAISDDTFVTRFTGEFGNGWLVTHKNKLVEIFVRNETNNMYRNTVTDEVIEIPCDKPVISSISKTKDNAYAVVFYPMQEQLIIRKQLIILNRTIAIEPENISVQR